MSDATMRAAVATPDGMAIREVPRPAPKPNEVLVKVRYSGLNRADLAGAAYDPKATAPIISGTDWSGDVVAVGSEVAGGYKPGDRVMCSGRGGYAEYAATDWGRVLPVPRNVSMREAGTLMVAMQTMHDALVTHGQLVRGDTVLIQGASAGVGLLGMQIAKLLGARVVIGTATNAERRARLAEYGCDVALDSNDPGWVQAALDATGGRGVDIAVDQVAGKTVNPLMNAMALLGRIVNVGRLGGASGELDFNLHALKRLSYIGVTFRTRNLQEVREITRKARTDLWEALESRKLRLPLDRTFPLGAIRDAHDHMRNNRHFGKILVEIAGEG